MPKVIIDALGAGNYQSADVVGRSVTLLMADENRHGELIYSECGKFRDLENGPKGYHEMIKKMLEVGEGEQVIDTGVLGLKREKKKHEGVKEVVADE